MTFNNAAWAIDGATMNSALARTEVFAALGGAEGVVASADLKVTPLSTPGNGVQIAAGSGVILNKYQGSVPTQSYVVSNPTTHLLGPGDMPASNPSPQTYVVAATIGDPEFSQSGHPWMSPSDPPAGTAATFKYARPFVMTSSAFAARNFPAIALAQIAIPASTTTITSGMITDLRALVRPRRQVEIISTNNTGADIPLVGTAFMTWPIAAQPIAIPAWATKAKIIANITGIVVTAQALGSIRFTLPGAGSTFATPFNVPPPSGADRYGISVGGVIDVSAIKGTTVNAVLQAALTATTYNSAFTSTGQTSAQILIQFEEAI